MFDCEVGVETLWCAWPAVIACLARSIRYPLARTLARFAGHTSHVNMHTFLGIGSHQGKMENTIFSPQNHRAIATGTQQKHTNDHTLGVSNKTGQKTRRPFQPRSVNSVSAPSPGKKVSLSGFFSNGFLFELCCIRE